MILRDIAYKIKAIYLYFITIILLLLFAVQNYPSIISFFVRLSFYHWNTLPLSHFTAKPSSQRHDNTY